MGRGRAVEVAIIALLLLVGVAVRMRVAKGWVYAGSDSYAYLKLGEEWLGNGRFALGPAEPLEWYRRPLYPLFLYAARHGARADVSGGDGWTRIEHAQIAVDVLVSGLLVLLIARRLGGRVGGIVALALAMLYPPTVLFSCAVLTEPLMAALTMTTLACLILGRDRPRLWFPVAAIFVALAAYLRPDGPLIGLAFIPALFYVDGWKRRGALAAISLSIFAVLFAPWPIRNVVHFGEPHLADGMVDRFGHDVPHYAGFWRWLQTWARDDRPAGYPQSCFYNVKCAPTLELFEEQGAFVAPATNDEYERGKVDALLGLRLREGVTKRVSDGLMALARRRRATHPWRVLVDLPLRRAWSMWSAPQGEVLDNPDWRPWPSVSNRLVPHLRRLSLLLLAGVIAGALILLLHRRTRVAAAILVVTVLARTIVLAWSAFCLPRNLIPIYPVCFVLIGAAMGVISQKLISAPEQD